MASDIIIHIPCCRGLSGSISFVKISVPTNEQLWILATTLYFLSLNFLEILLKKKSLYRFGGLRVEVPLGEVCGENNTSNEADSSWWRAINKPIVVNACWDYEWFLRLELSPQWGFNFHSYSSRILKRLFSREFSFEGRKKNNCVFSLCRCKIKTKEPLCVSY